MLALLAELLLPCACDIVDKKNSSHKTLKNKTVLI
jgi:hypothetical protein